MFSFSLLRRRVTSRKKIDDSPSQQKHVVNKLCTNLNPAFLKMANFLHRNSKHKLERERERKRDRQEQGKREREKERERGVEKERERERGVEIE